MGSSFRPALVVGLLLILNGCGGSGGGDGLTPDDGSPAVEGSVSWEACRDNALLQCATLKVLQDHRNLDGPTIDIALNRMPATAADPLGSLLFNPGGPGGSGIELIEAFAEHDLLPPELVARYHIVGFDPRGVNHSTPVDCREFDLDDVDEYPLDVSDLQQSADSILPFVSDCHDKYGDYLLYLGSEAVVDDMEAIRLVLGEAALNFVGYSYGTRLAGIYAQKYPTTTGRLVLDGSLPPTHDSISLFREQLLPLESNLRSFAQACSAFSDCNPDSYKAALEARVATLIENGAEFELGLLATTLFAGVEEPDLIDEIAQPLYRYMQDFDTAVLLELVLSIEADDGQNEDSDYDSDTAGRAVICADDPVRPSVAEIESLRQPFNAISDLFAEIQLADAAVCMGWPEALHPLAQTATTQAPESLVIGGPTDALTPLVWSEQMAAAIGGRFLRSEHAGHTTVFSGANRCTDTAALDYLLTGTLPAMTVCTADESQ